MPIIPPLAVLNYTQFQSLDRLFCDVNLLCDEFHEAFMIFGV